jgi:hypothetical protein
VAVVMLALGWAAVVDGVAVDVGDGSACAEGLVAGVADAFAWCWCAGDPLGSCFGGVEDASVAVPAALVFEDADGDGFEVSAASWAGEGVLVPDRYFGGGSWVVVDATCHRWGW